MPTADQLKLLFGAFPLPLSIASVLFLVAWLMGRKKGWLFDADRATGQLDIWALAVAFAAGQHAIDGFSGLPPKDALDWLSLGLLAIAALSTLCAIFKLPAYLLHVALALCAIATLALTLNGFQLYRDNYPLVHRLLVFGALSIAMLASGISLQALAARLRLMDFFLLTGIVGSIGAAILFDAYHTAKTAQLLGLALAVGGAGFIVGAATKTRHVSAPFAWAWCLIWTGLVSNAYFANYELPPSVSLCLLLAFPIVAGVTLLAIEPARRPVLSRVAVAAAALATTLLAMALASPPGEETDEEDDPYADWGS